VHVTILVLIIGPLLLVLPSPSTTKANSSVEITTISPFLPKLPPGAKKAGGGGGGGAHDPLPASRGKLPKFAMTQFTPPKVVTNPNARLAMTPTVLGPPELKLPSPNMNNWGDPLSKVINDSNGRGYGYPACIYCPQAQYSDEAVKAKYQGTVTLVAIITAEGKATDIQVLKGLGLGLDEKAIEAVRTWRFRPAAGPNGRPSPVRQTIEVTFHLY
jgi:TonB family protein